MLTERTVDIDTPPRAKIDTETDDEAREIVPDCVEAILKDIDERNDCTIETPGRSDGTLEIQRTSSLAESALEDMGVDTTEANLSDSWEVVSPGSEEARDESLGELFDSESESREDYATEMSGLGLLQLVRGQPITIDWDGAELTLYPPVRGENGGEIR